MRIWRRLVTVLMMMALVIPAPSVLAIEGGKVAVDSEALNKGLETPGVFRVGMEANYAPYNWSQTSKEDGAVEIANAKGEYANGYDVQTAKRIADALGLKLEVVKM